MLNETNKIDKKHKELWSTVSRIIMQVRSEEENGIQWKQNHMTFSIKYVFKWLQTKLSSSISDEEFTSWARTHNGQGLHPFTVSLAT